MFNILIIQERIDRDVLTLRHWTKIRGYIESVAAELSKKSEPVIVAYFLNTVGPTTVHVFNPFRLTDEDTKIKAFSEFYSPKTNEVYERFFLYGRNQAVGEPFDQFFITLIELSRTCGFGALENRMWRDRIVCGVSDKRLHKCLLEVCKLDYAIAREMARASVASSFQSSDIPKKYAAYTQLQSLLVDTIL